MTTINETQKLAIYGPNLRSAGETFHVHRAGCADCRRPLYHRHTPLMIDPGDVPGSANWSMQQVVIEEVYADIIHDGDDWRDFAGEFRFFPCTKGPER